MKDELLNKHSKLVNNYKEVILNEYVDYHYVRQINEKLIKKNYNEYKAIIEDLHKYYISFLSSIGELDDSFVKILNTILPNKTVKNF